MDQIIPPIKNWHGKLIIYPICEDTIIYNFTDGFQRAWYLGTREHFLKFLNLTKLLVLQKWIKLAPYVPIWYWIIKIHIIIRMCLIIFQSHNCNIQLIGGSGYTSLPSSAQLASSHKNPYVYVRPDWLDQVKFLLTIKVIKYWAHLFSLSLFILIITSMS